MLLYLLFKLIVIDFNEVILKYKKYIIHLLFLHIYILKRNYTVKKKSSIYTETYIFDTYIFLTDYTALWSVNPLSFLFI
jgi:hypothetical protein